MEQTEKNKLMNCYKLKMGFDVLMPNIQVTYFYYWHTF